MIMAINFDNALGIHGSALKFRAQRAEVLANNLANVDTPNFKARDIDFKSQLNDAMQAPSSGKSLSMASTDDGHMKMPAMFGSDDDLLYRSPLQPSLDGNTVEEQVEHAEYMKNSLQFQASFTILNGKFKGLQRALKGE